MEPHTRILPGSTKFHIIPVHSLETHAEGIRFPTQHVHANAIVAILVRASILYEHAYPALVACQSLYSVRGHMLNRKNSCVELAYT